MNHIFFGKCDLPWLNSWLFFNFVFSYGNVTQVMKFYTSSRMTWVTAWKSHSFLLLDLIRCKLLTRIINDFLTNFVPFLKHIQTIFSSFFHYHIKNQVSDFLENSFSVSNTISFNLFMKVDSSRECNIIYEDFSWGLICDLIFLVRGSGVEL